jgi:oxygen-dependent protoporphyrinogen oxidase
LEEAFKLNNRPPGLNDESVDSFLRRRFGDDFAQIFGSALIHGIYASDSRQIGIRSAFPTMWDAAERGWGSIIRSSLLPSKKALHQDYDTGTVAQLMSQASVFSFRDGLQALTDAMESYLAKQGNVEILRASAVSEVVSNGPGMQVRSSDTRCDYLN